MWDENPVYQLAVISQSQRDFESFWKHGTISHSTRMKWPFKKKNKWAAEELRSHRRPRQHKTSKLLINDSIENCLQFKPFIFFLVLLPIFLCKNQNSTKGKHVLINRSDRISRSGYLLQRTEHRQYVHTGENRFANYMSVCQYKRFPFLPPIVMHLRFYTSFIIISQKSMAWLMRYF